MTEPILILCLGNEALSDDAFGPTIARRLEMRLCPCDRVEVVFAPVAGFALLDLMQKRERVLVIDSIQTGSVPAGTLHFFPMGRMTPSRNLTTSHQMSLPTAMELGRRMGYAMPEEIDVLAVEVADVTTLSEAMTRQVEAAIEGALEQIEKWVRLGVNANFESVK
ncbi:MAG: hydrogenase maturation protease [Candidatus Zixiibacteriota bacterium]